MQPLQYHGLTVAAMLEPTYQESKVAVVLESRRDDSSLPRTFLQCETFPYISDEPIFTGLILMVKCHFPSGSKFVAKIALRCSQVVRR